MDGFTGEPMSVAPEDDGSVAESFFCISFPILWSGEEVMTALCLCQS